MIVPFLLFWLLVGWGLKGGDLYPKEAGIFASIWLVFLLCFVFFKIQALWFVVPTVALDIVLILKIFGQDIQLR